MPICCCAFSVSVKSSQLAEERLHAWSNAWLKSRDLEVPCVMRYVINRLLSVTCSWTGKDKVDP